MSAPVTLITGCSSGIGLASALEFARRGHTVVATMRDLIRSDALLQAAADHQVKLDVRVMDVADDESVRRGVAAVLEDHGSIESVVSNAGLGVSGTTEEVSIDDFRASLETNVLGSVRLLHALLPSWRQRRSGRFVAVSSVAGALGQPFNDSYCMSKFALEGLLESLRPVAAQFGIHVSMIEPGPVRGVFVDKSRPSVAVGTDDGSDDPYGDLRARFQIVQEGGYAAAQTNDEIAKCLWDVVTAEHPALRNQTSEMVTKMVALKLKDLDGGRVVGLTTRWVAPSH